MLPTPMVSTIAFVLIVLGLCALFVWTVQQATSTRTARRVAAGTALWLVLTGIVNGTGVLAASPVFIVGFMVVCNLLALAVALSPLGDAIARWAPLWALVGVQAFRVPLEVVLHDWAMAGSIPLQMSWEGDNIDVISGIVAAVGGLALWRGWAGQRTAWVVTLIGLGLLGNVAQVAIRSTPGPALSYPATPPLLLAFSFPHGWIVPFCVSGALLAHVVALRKLTGR